MLRLKSIRGVAHLIASSSALALIIAGGSAFAQEPAEEIEEITVTGSYIKGANTQGALPVSVMDRNELESFGAPTTTDIVNNLVINTGSENRSNALGAQNRNTGTANINLRGLGLDKTLVLFNSKRQTIHSSSAGDGSSFVDINMIPSIAIERIEILKDGAAATYGSDAVAGVANFITRTEFNGLEVSSSYRNRWNSPDMAEWDVSGIWGWSNDKTNLVVSGAYSRVEALNGGQLDWTTAQLEANRGASSLAGPGAIILTPDIAGGQLGAYLAYVNQFGAAYAPTMQSLIGSGYPIADPGCTANGGIFFNVAGGVAPLGIEGLGFGRCGYDFTSYYDLSDDQEKVNVWSTFKHELSDTLELYAEAAYYTNSVSDIRNSPSFPVLKFEKIPAENPGNWTGMDGIYLGRPFGQNYPPSYSWRDYKNYRFVGGLKGEIGSDWEFDTSVSYSSSEVRESTPTVVQQRFHDALNGFGGPSCDPATGTPGVGNCMWFNPFSTRWSSIPNDPSVEAYLRDSNDLSPQTASLLVFDAVFTRDLWDMAAGTVQGAFGVQYREDSLEVKRNLLATIPDSFIFVGGGAEMNESQDVYAVFGELAVPLADKLEAQLALRYEDYGSQIGDTIDPKVALLWTANDKVALRGSMSTTFRAPTLHQRFNRETALIPLTDVPKGGGTPSTGYKGAESSGNPDLQPESATTYNLGVVFTPIENASVTIDYWNIDFKDVIGVETPQTIVSIENALCVNRTPDCRDEHILRNPADATEAATGDNLQYSGEIRKVIASFVNAPSVKTDGIDISARYEFPSSSPGIFTVGLDYSQILKYDISGVDSVVNGQITQVTIDAVDNRNYSNMANPIPGWRGNGWLNYTSGAHSSKLVVRYIDNYNDDKTPDHKYNYMIGAMTTVDFHYSYTFNEDATTVAFNITNVTDENPPFADQDLNFDARTHNPFGRQYQLIFKHNFNL